MKTIDDGDKTNRKNSSRQYYKHMLEDMRPSEKIAKDNIKKALFENLETLNFSSKNDKTLVKNINHLLVPNSLNSSSYNNYIEKSSKSNLSGVNSISLLDTSLSNGLNGANYTNKITNIKMDFFINHSNKRTEKKSNKSLAFNLNNLNNTSHDTIFKKSTNAGPMTSYAKINLNLGSSNNILNNSVNPDVKKLNSPLISLVAKSKLNELYNLNSSFSSNNNDQTLNGLRSTSNMNFNLKNDVNSFLGFRQLQNGKDSKSNIDVNTNRGKILLNYFLDILITKKNDVHNLLKSNTNQGKRQSNQNENGKNRMAENKILSRILNSTPKIELSASKTNSSILKLKNKFSK